MWQYLSVATIAAAALSTLAVSADDRKPIPPDSVGWKLHVPLPTEVDPSSKQSAPAIVPRHLQPLGKPFPFLWVNEAMERTVISPTSRDVWVTFTLPPAIGQTVYIRIAPKPLDASTCPAAGTPVDVGTANLEAIDGFHHPLRSRILSYELGGHGGVKWNLKEPRLSHKSYFVQACVINSELRYTGVGTNPVAVELAPGLPDLIVTNAGVLRRTDAGKIYFIVADRISRPARDVRGTTIEYEVSTPSGSIPTVRTSAPLAPSGLSWIVSDFRIPDDGLFHDVVIRINMARAVPEENYGNNQTTYRFRVRATPAVFVFDTITVRESCDGAWLLKMRFPYGAPAWSCFVETSDFVDVDDGSTYALNIGFELIDLPRTEGAYVEFHAAGRDYTPGTASFRFSSADRASGTPQTQTSRGGACGNAAFTATVRYLDRAAADASGVRIYGTFDVSGGRCTMISPPAP